MGRKVWIFLMIASSDASPTHVIYPQPKPVDPRPPEPKGATRRNRTAGEHPTFSVVTPNPIHADTGSRTDHLRRRILDAARELLRSHGGRRFSVEAVAACAGLTRRTIYNQFADRDALYRASRLELLDAVAADLPEAIDDEMPLRMSMEFFFAAVLEVMTGRNHHEFWHSMNFEGAGQPWLRSEYEKRVIHPLQLLIEHQILLRSNHGEMPAADPRQCARSILTTVLAATAFEPDWSYTSTLTAAELSALFLMRVGAETTQRGRDKSEGH
jgi:AcrR family transcriptional regulator